MTWSRLTTRANLSFKHQLANSLGVSYEYLTIALVEGTEVEETRLRNPVVRSDGDGAGGEHGLS